MDEADPAEQPAADLAAVVPRGDEGDATRASVDEIDAARPYADLAACVLRGTTCDPSPRVVPIHELQDFYRVRLSSWDEMLYDLLSQICADAGSLRKASKALDVPRSTLSAKLKRYQERVRRSW